jgi:probable HAF family extracellular repeat protein
MKTLPLFLIGLTACLALGASAQVPLYPIKYSLADLGVVKGMKNSAPTAINNQAQIAGTAYSGTETCAFHYDYAKGFMEDVGALNSRGFGVSSMGVVVGDFFPGSGDASHAAILQGTFAKDLGVLKGQMFSRANGVNAMLQIVGYSGLKRDATESRAFLWTSQTGMMDIGTLGGRYAQAYAINDGGFITGTAETRASSPTAAPTTHAFIYNWRSTAPVAMRDLGVLGGLSSYGTAINASNHVAGYSTIKPNDPRFHAFLHDGTGMIDLGSLAQNKGDPDISVALGINNSDQVVGYSFLPGTQVAFLWSRGIAGENMIDLNKAVDQTGKDYLLISATGINDNGQIVCSAYDIHDMGVLHTVVLTPVK